MFKRNYKRSTQISANIKGTHGAVSMPKEHIGKCTCSKKTWHNVYIKRRTYMMMSAYGKEK